MKCCEMCSKTLRYSERWDSYFCCNYNVWSEQGCKDPTCEFCVDRPEKPCGPLDKEKFKRYPQFIGFKYLGPDGIPV